MTQYMMILTTTARMQDATRIAERLVDQRLAGCVQIGGPMLSTYRWEGAIQRTEEYMVIIKSRADLYETVEAAIKEVHPYDVPEIVGINVEAGSNEYLGWLAGELREEKH